MSESIENNKLFVGNLAWNVRRQELKEFFGQWGEVAYASVSLDRESKRSRGFGFVTFVNAEDAAKAKTESVGTTLNDRELYVDFARAREDDPKEKENDSKTKSNDESEIHAEIDQEEKEE